MSSTSSKLLAVIVGGVVGKAMTYCKSRQSLKACAPMVVTDSGIVSVMRLVP